MPISQHTEPGAYQIGPQLLPGMYRAKEDGGTEYENRVLAVLQADSGVCYGFWPLLVAVGCGTPGQLTTALKNLQDRNLITKG